MDVATMVTLLGATDGFRLLCYANAALERNDEWPAAGGPEEDTLDPAAVLENRVCHSGRWKRLDKKLKEKLRDLDRLLRKGLPDLDRDVRAHTRELKKFLLEAFKSLQGVEWGNNAEYTTSDNSLQVRPACGQMLLAACNLFRLHRASRRTLAEFVSCVHDGFLPDLHRQLAVPHPGIVRVYLDLVSRASGAMERRLVVQNLFMNNVRMACAHMFADVGFEVPAYLVTGEIIDPDATDVSSDDSEMALCDDTFYGSSSSASDGEIQDDADDEEMPSIDEMQDGPDYREIQLQDDPAGATSSSSHEEMQDQTGSSASSSSNDEE